MEKDLFVRGMSTGWLLMVAVETIVEPHICYMCTGYANLCSSFHPPLLTETTYTHIQVMHTYTPHTSQALHTTHMYTTHNIHTTHTPYTLHPQHTCNSTHTPQMHTHTLHTHIRHPPTQYTPPNPHTPHHTRTHHTCTDHTHTPCA